MKTIIRWALLVPSALASWVAVLYIGALSYRHIDNALCPGMGAVYGMCINEELETGPDLIIMVFACLSALAVGITAVAMAPSHKIKVTWGTFLVGAIPAALIAKPESIAALVVGFIGAATITFYLRGRT